MGECIAFDPQTRRPYYNTAAYEHSYWNDEMGAREISAGVIEFTNVSAREMPPVGSVWDDKGPFGRNRSYPGIAILSSRNVTVEDVHVYRSGAMALIAEYSENITSPVSPPSPAKVRTAWSQPLPMLLILLTARAL